MIPITKPLLGDEEIQAVTRVVRSGWLAQGGEVARFEQAVAAFVGVRHAVAVSSGTAALHLGLLALEIGSGDEVVVPALQRGAETSGRTLQDLDMIGAPFLAIAKDEEGIEAAKQALRQHIAFYASTRTYHAVLEFHGWLDAGNALHQMSREGRWKEMPGQITDEMLDEWAIIGTCDELASKLKERCSDIFSTVLLDLSPQLRRDEDWVAGTVDSLHRD